MFEPDDQENRNESLNRFNILSYVCLIISNTVTYSFNSSVGKKFEKVFKMYVILFNYFFY